MASKADSQPLYLQIYQYLTEEIAALRLLPGNRIPSEKELAARFKVSRITSKSALDMLAREGLIERVPGKGSFVVERGAGRAALPAPERRSGKLLGLVIPDMDDAFGTMLTYGIEERCRELGYHLLLHRSRDLLELEQETIERLLETGIAGILVLPVHGEHYNPVILRLVLDRFPLVFVDRHLRGLAASSIGTDNVAAARRGSDFLIGLGHRSIGFISSTTENTSTIEDRLDGFVLSYADHGLTIDSDLWVTDLTSKVRNSRATDSAEQDVQRVQAHLASHPAISAVFAVEYMVAQIVREAARRLGRRIPEDLSLLCFDSPQPHVGPVEFTHVRQKEWEMGTQAVQMIHDQLQGNREIQKVLLDAELVPGRSTAPPG
jgi:DNA-binding LacI/PurR family transcriptional regulator